MKTILFGSALGSLLAAAALAQIPVRYTVTDLGLVGGPPGQPIIIMNNGLVGGSAAVADGTWHSMYWYKGMKIDVGKPGLGGSSTVFGLNERGIGVGEAESANPDPGREDFCGFGSQHVCLPFVWQYGVMTALPTLTDSSGAAARNGVANAINNRDEIAGTSENTTLDATCPPIDGPLGQYQKLQFKPVVWQGGKIQELLTIDGDPDGIAFSVNDRGQVVGGTGTCTAFQANGNLTYLFSKHATIWQNGTVTDLGSLGGVASGGGNVALHINNRGQAVGLSGTPDGNFHGFLWSRATGMLDVGTVDDDVSSVALFNNDRGDVTGISFDADFNPRAFLRPDGGKPVDLNSLIPAGSELYLIDACSINSRGEVIGIALDTKGKAHGYLATPGY
jgi:probable HAF family extracellular repeat protein